MGILSSKSKREELKAGDHIYSWRKAYVYAHHGIYVGNGMVIHFTRGAGQEIGTGTVLDRFIFSSSSVGASNNPCPRCGYNSRAGGVILSCIDCFLEGGELDLYEYGASPALLLANPGGGLCTVAKSDPPEDVVHRANFLLQNGFGDYDALTNNCVDFAVYCKTSLLVTTNPNVGRSGMAASLLGAIRHSTSTFGGLPVVGIGMHSVNRLASDIGVRSDVVKVPVESLVARPSPD